MEAAAPGRELGKRFGGFVALESIDLEVAPGERLGLIGPNGSGKSTLVNCISGTLRNETGTVHFDGHTMDGLPPHQRTRLGLARSFQLPQAVPQHDRGREPARAPALHRQRAARDAISPTPRSSAASRSCCSRSGLTEKSDRRPRDLTQIEMRKLELARAMAAAPKLLIADEAMAGLSHSEVDDILTLLREAQRARHHRDPDRAHHARGDELLAAARRAGRRQEDRRRQARRT